MVLYHFCSARDVKPILEQGVTRGMLVLPTLTGYSMRSRWQWLTADPDPAHQSWATQKQQQRNRRNNHRVLCAGKVVSMAEAAEITGVNYNTLKNRARRKEVLI